jgi:cytochrome c553
MTLRLHLLWLLCAQTALLVYVLPMAETRAAERRVMGDVQAKLAYCEDCHGRAAQGFHGYFPIPRLAGQQPEYLKNQLEAFIERRRTNNVMFNVAHSLSQG